MAALPQVDRQKYLETGFLVLKGIIDVSLLDRISQEISDLFTIQLRRLGQPVTPGYSREAFRENATRLLATDVAAYINTARLTQSLPSIHRLLICDTVMDVASKLGIEFPVISTRPSIHIASNDLRIPNGYHKSPAHQDWRAMQGSLDSIVFWIPLTEVNATSNPMEFVPGSHAMGLLNTVQHIMTPEVSDPRITEDKYVPMLVSPGDAIFFSSFLVHRTSERDDGLVRIALSGRLNNALERTYVEHGYPTPYKYSYQTDLIYEGFPTKAQLGEVFPAVLTK